MFTHSLWKYTAKTASLLEEKAIQVYQKDFLFQDKKSKVNQNVNLLKLNCKTLCKNVFLSKIYFSISYSVGSTYFIL